MVEFLPNMHEALGSTPSTARNKEEKNEEVRLWRAYEGREANIHASALWLR